MSSGSYSDAEIEALVSALRKRRDTEFVRRAKEQTFFNFTTDWGTIFLGLGVVWVVLIGIWGGLLPYSWTRAIINLFTGKKKSDDDE